MTMRTIAPALLLFVSAPPVLALALVVSLAAPSPAHAGTIKGAVKLPPSARSGRLHQGYWRIENGNLPVRPAGAKAGSVVVLEGVSGAHAPPAKTVTVEIAGLDAQPRVVVIGAGSVVEFKNVGKITHELSTPADTAIMPIERLEPGRFRHQRFSAPGGYVVRCSEYPHLAISVIVVDSPHYALIDERGGFTIPAVPDGKATLKVWSMGRWVHTEPLDVAGAKQELTVRVAPGKGGKDPEGKDSDAKDAEAE